MNVELVEGQTYTAKLRLPADTSQAEFAPALEVLGFADVEVVGYRGGLWVVRGRWAGASVVAEVPEVVAELQAVSKKTSKRQEAKETRKQGGNVKRAPRQEKTSTIARPPARRGAPLGDPDPALKAQPPPISQAQVNELFKLAWDMRKPGESYTPRMMQAILAVGWHETANARGWKDPMKGSFNYGAIQCGHVQNKSGECYSGCQPYGDSRPTPQGQVAYKACFATYQSDLAGIAALISTVYTGKVTRADLDSGDLDRVALGMRKNFYFGGICTKKGPSSLPPCSVFDDNMAAAQYANALEKAAIVIARNGGTPLVVRRSGRLGEVPSTDAQGRPVWRSRPPLGGTVHLVAAGLFFTAVGVLASALDVEVWLWRLMIWV